MKYTPHEYQKICIQFLLAHPRSALFLDPGYGKTSSIYAALKILRAKGLAKRMLVIAPLRPAYSVWPGEAEKWDDFAEFKVSVLHGDDKNKLLSDPHDVSVINPEGLDWLFSSMKKRGWWWDVLVIDESTKFKHTTTKRFKALRPFLPKFKRRHILTGTPAPNGLMDLFGQMYILDLGKALGQFITHYRMQYFDKTGFGGFEYKLRPGSDVKIYEKIKPLVLRMTGDLHLPPLLKNTIDIELPEKSQDLYDEMEAEMLIELNSQTITAVSAAAATNKCRQIANGGIYTEGGKWLHIHHAKTDAVEDLVEELSGKPALVAYEYKHDLERLQQRFPGAPFLGGGLPPKRQREVEDAWNNGWIPVLFAQPQSVAHGLNLQGTSAAIIWHSLTWDLELYLQLNARIWRQGQKDPVVLHHLRAKRTIDEAMLGMLSGKGKTQQRLLAAVQSYAREKRVF